MTGNEQTSPRRLLIHEAASSYLPRLLAERLCKGPRPAVPWLTLVDGTLLMADVSGFTALSEHLSKHGQEGAERLTEIINRFFSRILGIARVYDGDTLGYGGDAVLLLFEGEAHAERAVACGLEMLQATERLPAVSAGRLKVKLGMSLGAHSSEFMIVCVGTRTRQHFIVVGHAAEEAARAEAKASKAQMFVTAETAQSIGEASCVEAEPGYWNVKIAPPCTGRASGRKRPAKTGKGQAVPIDADGDDLLPFLPPWIADALGSGTPQRMSAPEHRRVSVVFVNVTGINEIRVGEGVGAVLDELQRYMLCLMELLDKHHGYLLSSDIAPEGFKLILTFGAPMAHEYAAANAGRFALEFDRQVKRGAAGRLRHRFGLNGGHVFAGEVGPSFRRQYTVMGDEVNLAARLMAAAAPGQILASASFLEHAGTGFCAQQLEPIRVKGKTEPVAVCLLEGERGEAAPQARHAVGFIGRKHELEAILMACQQAQEGQGSALVVEGDAGVGKTRLVEEVLEKMAPQANVVRFHSYEHLQSFPLAPWVEALDGLLGSSRHQVVGERTALAWRWLEQHLPGLVDLAPLLNPLLAVSFPVTDVVRSLDGQGRQNRLFHLIGQMVNSEAGRGLLILLFEDLHWADATSIELFRAVTESSSAACVLLLATARPSESPLGLGAGVSRLRLRELGKSEAMSMLLAALGMSRLPTEVLETVYAKTRGNPLFLEEVIHALQAPGVLDSILCASSVQMVERLASLEIPDRVQGLLMSRVDRLPPDSREVAKAASVIGQTFDEETLRGIDDPVLGRASLPAAFRDLVYAGLAVVQHSGHQPTPGAAANIYRFRHALVQQVAYDSLPFARRRRLHHQTARFLESRSASPDHGLLVHHYRNAGDRAELRDHALKAAQASSAVYAYREGIDYLTLALGTLTARTAEQACLRSRIEETAGDYLEALGRQDEAVKRYTKSRERWKSPSVRQASAGALLEVLPISDMESRDGELCYKIAAALERHHGVYGQALRWLDEGTKVLPSHNAELACRLRMTRSLVYARLGRHRDALALCEESVELARHSGDAALETYALTRLFVPCMELGLFARAMDASKRAVELSEQLGDIAAEAKAHGNLGICHHATGDVKAALTHYELARSLELRLGYSTGLILNENNIGELMFTMGRFEEALQHLEVVVGYCREQRAVGLMGIALTTIARAKVRLSRLEEASASLAEAKACLKAARAEGSLLDAELVEAELDLARHQQEAALQRAERVLEKARAIKGRLTELNVLLFLGSTHIEYNDLESAEAEIDQALELARDMGMLYEQGLAQLELARLRATARRGQVREPLQDAIAIFEKTSAEYDLSRATRLQIALEQSPRETSDHTCPR